MRNAPRRERDRDGFTERLVLSCDPDCDCRLACVLLAQWENLRGSNSRQLFRMMTNPPLLSLLLLILARLTPSSSPNSSSPPPAKQIRERYTNYLDPALTPTRPFTVAEDAVLKELVVTHGTKWSLIRESGRMPGRSENAMKNRYFSKAFSVSGRQGAGGGGTD